MAEPFDKGKALAARKLILERVQTIENAYRDIDSFAKNLIPDFHFMDYKVSTFWECDESPIGMCLFKLDQQTGRPTYCRYCGDPVERK